MRNYDKLMTAMAMSIARKQGLPTDLEKLCDAHGQKTVSSLFDRANSNIIAMMMTNPSSKNWPTAWQG